VVYVLAVMLERGKQLIERDTKPHESGGILRIYEDKISGDTFVVLDPKLHLDKLAIVQQQVVALLSGTQTLGEEKSEERSVKSEAVPEEKSEEVCEFEQNEETLQPASE